MRALIIENFPDTHAGHVGLALDEAGAEMIVLRPHTGDPLPDTTDPYDAMVILGGAQDALDDDGSPYFPKLLDLIRDRTERDAPLLGICLGGQLISRALGAGNHIGGHLEFGYCEVSPLPASSSDPLLSGLSEPLTTFQWHTDAMTVPEGAIHLMTSPVAPVQAYRVGDNIYATQFHFEASREMADTWVGKAGDWLDAHMSDWRDVVARFPDEAPGADVAGLALARRWVQRIGAGKS
ncbi:MAG: type 1 glutamine amidotransferase [Pseudomonadota bacterium]